MSFGVLEMDEVGKVSMTGRWEGEEKASLAERVADEDVQTIDPFRRLKESEPSEWLAAPSGLVDCAKRASETLFSVTANSFEKAPLTKLYTYRFDAEQIWQQIDLQSHPVLSYIRRKLRTLGKSRNEDFFTGLEEAHEKKLTEDGEPKLEDVPRRQSDSESEDDSEDMSQDADMEDKEARSVSPNIEEDDDDDEEIGVDNGVEDEFFKISEMEKFLDRTDAEGVFGTGKDRVPSSALRSDGEEDEDDSEAEESGEGEDEDQCLGFGKYEEFFGNDKRSRRRRPLQEEKSSSDSGEDGLSEDDEGTISAKLESNSLQVKNVSTHQKRMEKISKQIKELEEASLAPKHWTLQGEVTAKKRPKNSALEVELDFDHNARPPPVITEEITASLEDVIRGRIAEGRYDDVQRKSAVQATVPKERVELDENKSKKGLGEIYEVEYMQKSGLSAAPTSSTEGLKQEAKELFRVLCSRLDALSHFHFAPKPVIEDMQVRADVPALAMEEVAPLAVSEASMLAPEEIFTGEDAIKADGELTPEERKRRRAQKKRKRKGEKRTQEADRIRKRIFPIGGATIEPRPTPGLKVGHSSYSKSSKVFAELDKAKDAKGKGPPKKVDRDIGQVPHASFLKL